MKMKQRLAGLAALPLFLGGAAMAGQPAPLSDVQMDRVTAGAIAISATLVSFPGLTINIPVAGGAASLPTFSVILPSIPGLGLP